jgi:hypothetical protein
LGISAKAEVASLLLEGTMTARVNACILGEASFKNLKRRNPSLSFVACERFVDKVVLAID